jgi:hypothetical protein
VRSRSPKKHLTWEDETDLEAKMRTKKDEDSVNEDPAILEEKIV